MRYGLRDTGYAPRVALFTLLALLVLFLAFYAIVVVDPFKKRAREVVVNAPATAALASPQITFADPKRGNVRGTVTLVEFGDYQCVYCKPMETTLNAALRAHPNLVLVWKDLPSTELHKEALPAANAARCAGRQGKFWEYHDLLFEEQANLGADLYPRLAERLGLQLGRFTACLAGNEENGIVLRNIEEAQALGVDGSPYFFLGAARITGAVTPAELAALLDQADPIRK